MDNYDKWNEVKKETEKSTRKLGLKSREIYWAKIGLNIGHEEYGKGKEFVRPVIVVKQLTSDLFVGIPTTSKAREDNNDYFHKISYVDDLNRHIQSTAMLLQQRVFSKKRLLSKIGKVNTEEFKIIIEKLKRVIDPTS